MDDTENQTITLPHLFKPRTYQLPFMAAIDRGLKRAILIWPRRHGKDKSCFNALIKEAMKRVGVYYYVFPEYNQGRKALWDNIDSQGIRTIDHVPDELVSRVNNQEMKLELVNGSIIQVVGAADIDRIVGTNPVGIVLSEYSLMNPMVIGFLMPILAENGGFLWANFTPRGDNHAKNFYESHLQDADWYVNRIDAYQAGVMSAEHLDKIKAEYIELYGDENLFNQEFLCSFESPVQGSYYGKHIQRAQEDGRITSVPYDSAVPVHTYWDLGVGDSTAIWFLQNVGKEVHIIDYYENQGEGLQHYKNVLNDRGYAYGTHNAPHDIKARELTNGKARIDTAKSLGINFKIIPNISIDDGIDAARTIFSKCWFDQKKCEQGLMALRNYHREFDEKKKTYRDHPAHDWSSHGADGFRYLAVGHKHDTAPEPKQQVKQWNFQVT